MSYYQMHRGWLDSEMFAEAAFDERSAWAWMIGEARWKDGHVPDRFKRPVFVKRGQVFSSIRFMSEKFQWSKDRVSRYLARLEKWGAIKVETATDQNIITICNYEEYQCTKDDPKDDIEDDVKDDPKDKQEEGQIKTNTLPAKKEDFINDKDFLSLWGSWKPVDMPKGNKEPAAKAFAKAKKETNAERIISSAKAYCADCAKRQSKTKHVSSWLNSKGWLDDYAPLVKQKSNSEPEPIFEQYGAL